MEIVVFLVGVVLVGLLIAWRNGAFTQRRHGDLRGDEAIPPVSPSSSAVRLRDPRPGRRQ